MKEFLRFIISFYATKRSSQAERAICKKQREEEIRFLSKTFVRSMFPFSFYIDRSGQAEATRRACFRNHVGNNRRVGSKLEREGREKYRGSEEDRSSGTGLESSISRPLHTDYYPRSENRFARRVIVAIWSTTSGRHDTKISIKLLAREDRISPSATEFFLSFFFCFSDHYLRRTYIEARVFSRKN